MLEDHARRAQALGARGADVVGAEHVEHAGAGQPHHGRHRVIAQRHGRQHEVPPGAVAGHRKPLEPDREDDDQRQREPEGRHRLPDDGDHQRQPVDPRVAVDGGQHAERNRHHHGQQQRDAAELERDRQAFADQFDHRVLEVERAPEIESHRGAEPVEELRRDRPVEPVLHADLLHVGGGGLRPGNGRGQVAREVQQHEADDGHGQHDAERDQQPAEDVDQHGRTRLLGAGGRLISSSPRRSAAARPAARRTSGPT